jgi:hypothetical protein
MHVINISGNYFVSETKQPCIFFITKLNKTIILKFLIYPKLC